MADVKIRLNGSEIQVPEGSTILAAATLANVELDSLYYLKGIVDIDDSGVCVVEVKGQDDLVNASAAKVADGMEILTDSEKVITAKVDALKKIAEIYNYEQSQNFADDKNEFLALCKKYQVEVGPVNVEAKAGIPNISYDRDDSKCIKCKRCVAVCGKIQGTGALGYTGEGLDAVIGPADGPFLQDFSLGNKNCVNCGQCVAVCPIGALTPKDNTAEVTAAIKDNNKFVVVQVAPAVRAALGEEFGLPIGTDVEGKLPAALVALGFDKVFDTKFGADLTIMEEATELIHRMEGKGALPLITSCCPGWIKYAEDSHQSLLDHISSCKSPHMMEGAIIKTYFANQAGIPKENIVVVSVMPCTAKKFEITRDNECGAGVPDVDISITTRELAVMLKKAGIDLAAMPERSFDNPLGVGTGAAVIFGATGGVMEAALRTAADVLTGEDLADITYSDVRGMSGVKEATVTISGKELKVAIVSGLNNVDRILENIAKGKVKYQFMEVMACPGGCINGGGQPYQTAKVKMTEDVNGMRAAALYANDENSAIRKSHKNPDVTKLYQDYLGSEGSAMAHELLHTSYVVR